MSPRRHWFQSAMRHLFRAARRTLPDRQPGETRFVVMPQQVGGVRVTEETALQISAVYACVTVIAKSIAASTWDVFEEAPDGTRELRRDTALYRLLNVAPNPEMTAIEFREALLISALMWHGGYAEIERDAVNRPIALYPLHPGRVDPDRTASGRLIYRIWNPGGPDTILDAADVFRIHGPGIDGLLGYDMARLAARAFGHSIATETFGAAFFGNGAHMGSVVESEQSLSPEQAEDFRKRLEEYYAGPARSHRTLVLGGGMSWKQQAIEPEKAQFIETRQHLVEEVCRFFGVPPHKIGHLLRATFNNIEHQGLEFVRDALTPWAERLRQQADAKLRPVNRRNLRTRIDLDWLSEGDAKARAEADSQLVNNGLMSRNEVRKRRGLNTIPDGDKFTVQQAMTTLARIGEDPTPPAPPAPSDDADGGGDAQEDRALRVVEN